MSEYKLIPVEPIEEMLAAGAAASFESISWLTAGWVYEAMLTDAPEVGWQPIETAPKTGAFLVTGGKMCDDLCPVDNSYDVALVNAAERGSRYEVRDTCYYSTWVDGATHWMPLTLPPKEC